MSDRHGLKEIAVKWIEEGWQKGNFKIIDELHSKDFVDHDPSGRSPDNEGFKEAIKEIYNSFPDFYTTIEDILVDEVENKVSVRWKAEGTHKKSFLGFNPTNKKIKFKGIEILKFKDDKITERWGEWDGIDLLDQLQKSF